MILLLDQGLPRSTVGILRDSGVEAHHTGDVGLSSAPDQAILQYAREHAQTVVTLDADFHALLALSNAPNPSVIRVRIEGLGAPELASLLAAVISRCREDVASGAMVTVTESGVRVRRLPLLRR